MSEHNADVDRAIAAFGGTHMKYHSFGPFTMRPRTTAEVRAFTYNEFGEPEYSPAADPVAAAPAQSRSEPLFDPAPPVLAPAPIAAPMPAPVARQPVAAPPPMAPMPRPVMQRPVNAAQSGIAAPYSRADASAGRPVPPRQAPPEEVPPMPAAPPPPPFFPLLASALPNATEPSYTPTYAQAPQPVFAPVPTAADPNASAAPAGSSADQRSLNEMFRLLSGRAEAAPPTGVAPAGAAAPEAQALFRRI